MSHSKPHRKDKPLSFVWLRRDLRLHDHAALHRALQEEGCIQPVFILDTAILARFTNPADRRLTFIAQTLCRLHTQLEERGSGLLVLHGRAEEVMPRLCAALEADYLVAAEDVEGEGRARDRAVADAVQHGTHVSLTADHWLMPSTSVLKKDGLPYHVFTPYAKVWRKTITASDLAERKVSDRGRYADYAALRRRAEAAGLTVLRPEEGPERLLQAAGYRSVDIPDWPVEDGQPRLKKFIDTRLADYESGRNYMAEDGTSALSPYLRFGLVSVRECARAAWDKPGADTWISELIWRDFYAMILYHYPELIETDFSKKYRDRLKWRHSEEDFQRWQEGKTGFPVVDAAMRQLTSIGWMHNRARMIVASFLTKHLRVDWRRGEEHFAQWLMDYDLASNNGGWQWAASTGTDSQPYFRVFNPTAQGQKFDPEGGYVRRWVSELAEYQGKDIHLPGADAKRYGYPLPMVDHAKARLEAVQMFKTIA